MDPTHSNASNGLLWVKKLIRRQWGRAYLGIKSIKVGFAKFTKKYCHIACQTRAICVRASNLDKDKSH